MLMLYQKWTEVLQAANSLQSGKASHSRGKTQGPSAGAHIQTPQGVAHTPHLFFSSNCCISKKKRCGAAAWLNISACARGQHECTGPEFHNGAVAELSQA